MRIGLIIAEFESSYSTSFQHTARVKYGVDFNTSNVDTLAEKLAALKEKVEKKQGIDVHVGLEITTEHVAYVQQLLHQILERYKVVFGGMPINRKIYTINQKLREAETPSPTEVAKEALGAILTPEKRPQVTRRDRIKADAEAVSKRRALDLIKKNSAKK